MASPAKKAKKAITTDTKVFNDPIHGSIELPPLLIKIIDTPQFQRLRFIRQLGGVYFVYPGASHNRFEHSIGVAYLAGELATALKTRQPELDITDRDILCVQIAGLCHDLGHGPFSHLYDDMFLPKAWEKKKNDIEKLKEKKKSDELKKLEELEKWKHEKGSCDMLDHLLKENNLKLETDDMKFMERMITKPLQESQDKKLRHCQSPLHQVMREYGLTLDDQTLIKEMVDIKESPGQEGSSDRQDQKKKEERLDQVMNKYGLTDEDVTLIKEMIAQDQKDQEEKKERLKQVMNKYGLTDEDVTFIKEMIAGPLKEGKQKKELDKLDQVMRGYGLTLDDVPFIQEMTDIKKPPGQEDEEKLEKLERLKQLKITDEHMTLIKNTIYKWPYEGRLKEKAFLYEIVSNKNTGIDVDKFDYLARDSYHLGIKNNFDYHRFKKFARVCELLSGRKTICTRDKEEDQMYHLFYTRHRLHKRACQHRVSQIIQEMIAEAFLEADDHIKFEGSEGFTLSTAFKDMEAYTQLTDNVFEKILNSPDDLKAKEILKNIITRKIYKFVGETRPKPKPEDTVSGEEWEKFFSTASNDPDWKETLAACSPAKLLADDFVILVINMNYGKKDKDPIEQMHFYSKFKPDEAKSMPKDQASRIRTTCFSEQLIRVFCKKTDEESVEAARQHFDQWLETKKKFLVGPEGN